MARRANCNRWPRRTDLPKLGGGWLAETGLATALPVRNAGCFCARMCPMSASTQPVTLQFDKKNLTIGKDVDIRNQLSAVVLDEDRLWLACDEGCRLERLTRSRGGQTFAKHDVFELGTLL